MRRALIVGSEGQDGRILFDRLTGDGLSVIGIGRASIRGSDAGRFAPVDVRSRADVSALLKEWRPSEIYYLAAVHQASEDAVRTDDARLFDQSLAVHVTGFVNVLDAARETLSRTTIFYAASSLVFGDVTDIPQDETTPLQPRCIYGITKAAGVQTCRYYRERHGLHVSAGILYNHESPGRRRNFVSRKIVRAAVLLARGGTEKLTVGSLSAQVDWGYAPDVIDAIIRIVRHPRADDYVVATGETHTVQEFLEIAFGHVGIAWQEHVEESPALLTRPPVARVGDSSRLRTRTGWRPSVSFREMVELLVDAELRSHVA